MNDVGKIAMLPKDVWSSAVEYEFLDIVTYNDSAFVARQNNTGHVPVGDANDNYWMLLVSSSHSGVSTFNGRSGSVLSIAGDYDDSKVILSSTMHISGEDQTTVKEALEALEARPSSTFNGRSGSILPMAGDYSAEDITYGQSTVKDALDNIGNSVVSSFNGRSGSVLPTAGDYTADKIIFSSIMHIGGETQSNVEDALNALNDVKPNIDDLGNVQINNLQNGQVLKYNSSAQKWVNRADESGGGGLKIGDVSGASASTVAGTKSVTLIWTDPNDVDVSGVTLAEWEGTLVVRKAGSAPTDKDDGTVILTSTTKNQYSSSGYVDSSVNYGTTYYYRFFPYTTGGLYTDGTSVNAIPSKATVAIPTPSDTLTYDGTEQTMSFTYDSTKARISGNTATNAGTHTAVASLISSTDYEWSDHTIADKNVSWEIAKAKVSAPTITGSFTYDGTEKTASVSSYDNTILSVTGTTGTNAGTYTATMSIINNNYWWTDETTADKTETWSIGKGAAGCTLSSNSVTLDPNNLSATVTISNATGTVGTPTSSDTTVCTVSKSDNTLTITSVNSKSGEVTISIPIAASSNYDAGTVTLSVTASFLKIVEWSDGTDAEIAAMLDAHYAGSINIYDYWEVGDERTVALSAMNATGVGESHAAQNVTLVLMNEGGKTLTTAVNGKSTCAFIVGQKHSLNETGYMNSSNTNSGGWDSCARRTWCNSVYKNALPSTLVGIFKQHQNITANGSSSSTATSNDYFALPSEKEVFGSTSYANSTAEASNTQFKYYETSSNRIKNVNGSAGGWWERSSWDGYSTRFCRVSSGGSATGTSASNDYGFAPFGCI